MFSTQVIHLVIHPDGHLRYDLMEKAVERASLAEPITRCLIIRDQDTLFWQEDAGFHIQDHVLRLSSRTPGDLLYHALSYPLDPYRGMLFQVILIENPGETGDIVVFNAHHIVMDGRGLKDFAGLVMRCYTGYQSGPLMKIPTTPVKFRQLPRVSNLIDETNPVEPLKSPPDWCSRISVPLQSLHVEKYQYSLVIFNQNRTAIIRNCRRAWNITMNDFMIAVLARAIVSVLGVQSEITVPLYTTIDLRRYLPIMPMRSLVNFSASFEVRIPVMPDESLEDTGRRVHLLMNRIKSQRPGLNEEIDAENIFESGYTAARDLINTAWNTIQDAKSKTTIFSNTGIINSEQVRPGCLSVRNAYLLPGFFQPPGFFFLLSTFEDIMTLSATYAVPAYDPDLVNRMLRSIDRDIPGFLMHPGEYEIIT